MISQLTQIAKIDALLGKMATTRFNAILPVNIEVMEKKPLPQAGVESYRLMIGKKEVETKSSIPLDVGGKYWGIMKENAKTNAIMLSQLLKKPKLLQKSQLLAFMPDFTPQKLIALLSTESPKAEMKLLLLEHLAQANSKQEFMTLANMIAALDTGVFTMLLKHQNKNTLFQFRKRKSQSQTSREDGMIDFYAAFEHIGPVEGVVEVQGDTKRLTLYLYYKESILFLQKELENLDFEGRLLPKKGQVSPLYEPVSSLLDIKG